MYSNNIINCLVKIIFNKYLDQLSDTIKIIQDNLWYPIFRSLNYFYGIQTIYGIRQFMLGDFLASV